MHYTTSCNIQSSVPEDRRDDRPKHVELTGIINKRLLLYLVGVYIICFRISLFFFFTFIYNKTYCFVGLGEKRRYSIDPRLAISLRCNFLLKILPIVCFYLNSQPKAVTSLSCDFVYCITYSYLYF